MSETGTAMLSEDKRERLAQTIYEALRDHFESRRWWLTWDEHNDGIREDYRVMARAAMGVLIPPGSVAIDRGRAERLIAVADAAVHFRQTAFGTPMRGLARNDLYAAVDELAADDHGPLPESGP